MENNQNQTRQVISQEEMIRAIYENTHKTKNYMKWQLYITIILIVLPLLSMIILLPLVMKSLSTLGGVYGGALLQ